MQTFVPLPNICDCARVLDRQRLGKQRLETKQILETLLYDAPGWRHHPVMKMWVGFELSLAHYGIEMCLEWINRGYRDTQLVYFQSQVRLLEARDARCILPLWWGDDAVHRSHRSNLLRKNPEHYRKFWPDDPDDLPYIWPKSTDRYLDIMVNEDDSSA